MRVLRLYAIPRPNWTNNYNNMCIRGYLFNIHQYHSKKVFENCTNSAQGNPFIRTDVTPNRFDVEMMKIVDRIVVDGDLSVSYYNNEEHKFAGFAGFARDYQLIIFELIYSTICCKPQTTSRLAFHLSDD